MRKIIIFLVFLILPFISSAQISYYRENFESYQTGNLRNIKCWDRSSSNVQIRKHDGLPHSGLQYAQAKNNEYIYCQDFNFEIGKTYKVSFWYNAEIVTGSEIITVTSNTLGVFTPNIALTIPTAGWRYYTSTFIPLQNKVGAFRINFSSSYSNYNILIDDIILESPSSSLTNNLDCHYFDDEPLPVTWISFTAKYTDKEKASVLKWSVSEEVNNKYFEIEGSNDCKKWETIGVVSGGGTVKYTGGKEYVYIDESNDFLYYRIKQFDYDDKFEYSKIATVGCCHEDTSVVKVYDFMGRTIHIGKLEDFYEKANPNQIYVIQLENGNTEKIVK